jgi:hypothetical protein
VRRLLFISLLHLLAALPAMTSARGEGSLAANEVKAALIYNFARFIQWPAEALGSKDAFTIGVLGDERLVDALEEMTADRAVAGRRIAVVPVEAGRDLRTVDVLFVTAGENPPSPRPGMLVVGEEAGFLERGGAVNFVQRGEKVRFELNLAAAHKARLVISSELVALADRVIGER